ncbi:Uncharacterised protein [Escherichia coli]|uniref:Uncharacterized protein n=1 Tax=Escherichia coli TaxID=562 RepID=A0A376LLA5_ECOLX|nr:Uncharacterised protein [Escherichia coli]
MTLVAGCGASALSGLGNERFVGMIRRVSVASGNGANAPSVNREITAIHQQIQRLGIGNHIAINQIDADARKRIHH